MNYLCDFHTHTLFCDGKSTPREMLTRAVELGFRAYGFSGHGGCIYDLTSGMSEENEQKYIAEVLSLKDEFSHRLPVLLGVEQEYDGKVYHTRRDDGGSPFDYIIGAVHIIDTPDGKRPLDLHPSNITDAVNGYFGGDFESLAESYYAKVKRIPERINASVIAHIDLITKFRNIIPLTLGERYFEAALGAVRALIPYGIPFEINVGAISRGYRTTPYPDLRILRYIRELGGEIMINGDCHSAKALGNHLDLAERVALAAGFRRKLVITEGGYDTAEL